MARSPDCAPGFCCLNGIQSAEKSGTLTPDTPASPTIMEILITLLVLGAVLIFLETILPGLVAGIIGFLCRTAAVIRGYRDFGYQTGGLILAGVLVGLLIGTWCWLEFFPESGIARKFISRGSVGELGADKSEFLNGTGTALSQLRPSGTASINGQRVDVVTEGSLIERGATIKVVAVEGSRVVVREA